MSFTCTEAQLNSNEDFSFPFLTQQLSTIIGPLCERSNGEARAEMRFRSRTRERERERQSGGKVMRSDSAAEDKSASDYVYFHCSRRKPARSPRSLLCTFVQGFGSGSYSGAHTYTKLILICSLWLTFTTPSFSKVHFVMRLCSVIFFTPKVWPRV